MKRETGWKPMPISIKVIFVLLCVSLAGCLNGIFGVYQYGYSFFGAYTQGFVAILLSLLFPFAAQLVLIVGLWKRSSWAGWYGFAFYLLLIVFSLLSFVSLDQQVAAISQKMIEQRGEAFPEEFSSIFYWLLAGVAVIYSLVSLVFAILVFRVRKYFSSG